MFSHAMGSKAWRKPTAIEVKHKITKKYSVLFDLFHLEQFYLFTLVTRQWLYCSFNVCIEMSKILIAPVFLSIRK